MRKKYIAPVCLLVLSVLLYSAAVFRLKDVEKYERYFLLRMKEQALPADRDADAAFIQSGDGKLYVQGDLSLIFPDVPSIDLLEEPAGCVISSGLARKTFGTTEAEGLTIFYEEKPYIVRGVTEYPFYGEEEIVLSPLVNEEPLYDGIVGIRGEAVSAKRTEQMLMNTYGVDGELLDTRVALLLFGGITALFLLLVGITVSVELYQCGKCKAGWKDTLILWACFAVVWGILLYFIAKQVPTALEECPAQWSDFDAWKSLFEERARAIGLFFDVRRKGFYGKVFFGGVRACVCTALASLFYLLGMWKLKKAVAKSHEKG